MRRIIRKALVASMLLICSNTWGVELQVPTRTILGSIAVGDGPGALHFGNEDPNEPYFPVSIQVTALGDFLIQEGFLDVARFNRDLKYLGRIGKGYQEIQTYGDFLIAWENDMDPRNIDVYQLTSKSAIKYSSGSLINIGRIETLWPIPGFFLITTSERRIAVVQLDPKKLFTVAFDDLPKLDVFSKYSIENRQLYLEGRGIISGTTGDFFLATGQSDLQYADAEQDRDSVNIARGRIFGQDKSGNRYIYHNKGRIGIASSSGVLLKVFDIRAGLGEDVKVSRPTLTLEGDIIYLESTSAGHKVIRITNK